MAEIRLFAGGFTPRNWSYCNGQLLSVSSNQALFALIGTTYGGDGRTSFGLPDLRGRIPVSPGQGPGLSNYNLGAKTGTETVSLLLAEMPQHSHIAQLTNGTAPPAASATLNGVNGSGGSASPGGNYIGTDADAGSAQYAPSGDPVQMSSNAITLTDVVVSLPNVQIGMNGGSVPHENIQPSLVLNYIICISGVFPSRN